MLSEYRETQDAINEMIEACKEYDRDYGYSRATGALQALLEDVIAQLPKSKREQYRARLYRMATDYRKSDK
jgi:hypothetical protein